MPSSEYEMAPIVDRHPVQSEKDVWELKLPDVKTAGSVPKNMELSKLQEGEAGMPIVPTIGPCVLTVSGSLAGVEQLTRWMIKKPALVHHLVKLAAAYAVNIARYWVDAFGPECLIYYIPAPTESNQIISPKQFEEFVLPYQKEVHEKVLAMAIKHLLVRICGEQNLNLPLWSQIPMGDPGIVSLGHEVDLETGGKHFPKDIIVGNVNPSILHLGTSEEVYELSKICIEKGKKALGGSMLAPGCTMSPFTSSYNYWVMHKALNEYGWY